MSVIYIDLLFKRLPHKSSVVFSLSCSNFFSQISILPNIWICYERIMHNQMFINKFFEHKRAFSEGIWDTAMMSLATNREDSENPRR